MARRAPSTGTPKGRRDRSVPAPLPFGGCPRAPRAVVGAGRAPRRQPPASCLRTSAATRPPSASPATLGFTIFMTAPIALGPSAPDSVIAAATIPASSASSSCYGR